MNNKDLRMAIVMMVIFIVLYGISYTFQSSGVVLTHTTAAFFPRVVLIMAMFLTLVIIIQSIRKGPDKVTKKMEKEAFRRVSGSMICAIALGFGAAYLGTFVSIALFIVAIMKVWGVQRKRPIIITAIVTPILIYFIFNQVLLVQLPAGILM